MEELDALLKLAEAGLTAFQTVAIVALWRRSERDIDFKDKLLLSELQARQDRKKLAAAVGTSLDDTIETRPARMDELEELRKSLFK